MNRNVTLNELSRFVRNEKILTANLLSLIQGDDEQFKPSEKSVRNILNYNRSLRVYKTNAGNFNGNLN